MRKLLRTAVLAAGILFAVTAAAPAAQASTNPFRPTALCGLGFSVKVAEDVVRYGDPQPVATFYLLHNPVSNLFCGVTIKEKYVGLPTETMAGLGGIANSFATDSGLHYYYAGPVWQVPGFSAPNCIAYGASLTDPAGNHYHETANPAIGWSRYCL